MSSDRSAVALERLDAAPDEGGAFAVAPARDLAELAAALARAEALINAGAEDSPDAAAAIERIADIAFVLHEREVEPSLCDALDAAMRDIGEANARNRANVDRVHEAAALLRSLARRLDAMMAAQAEAQVPESDAEGELSAPAQLFDADLAEDKAFAETVAALAQSLPEAASVPAQSPAEEPVSGTGEETAGRAALPESADVGERTFAGVAVSGDHVWPAAVEAVASLASSAAIVAAPAVETHQAVDPDEDPGDLFEPMPGVRPAASDNADGQPPQSSSGPGAPAYAAPRLPANDPLAPIRALSEEELIALFS
jgi:hypothetical protein